MKSIIFAILFIFSFASCGKEKESELMNNQKKINIGISFPPVSNTYNSTAGMTEQQFSLNHLKQLNSKYFRFADDWKNRETSLGVYNWSAQDQKLDFFVNSNNFRILLTIQSNGPTFRCTSSNSQSCIFQNNNDFKTFIKDYITRYQAKISKIQFGNEMLSDSFYIGTANEYVASQVSFYNAVKAINSNIPVVLGGFSAGTIRRFSACKTNETFILYDGSDVYTTRAELDTFCKKTWVVNENSDVIYILNNAKYDEVDLHLYDDPEYWAIYFKAIRDIVPLDKKILISEFGGPNKFISNSYTLTNAVTVLNSLDVNEAYFFKLVEFNDGTAHEKSGLISNPSLNTKKEYFVIQSNNN